MPTDIGFTGQRLDASTGGLMFYGARYYSPYLNRWIQPDSIVPDPSNPQSLNRFSYVRNNPVRYTDPTGHRECNDSQSGCVPLAPVARANPHANPYGLHFIADEGQSWGASEVQAAIRAAASIAGRMTSLLREENRMLHKSDGIPLERFRNAVVFRRTFRGGVTFHKSSQSGFNLYTDPIYGGYKVLSYSGNTVTAASAAHELGHAFAQRLEGEPYTFLASAAGEITFPNGGHIAGGGGERKPYGMVGDYLQNPATVADPERGVDPTHEDFADMFAHWTYGWFTDDKAGAGRARQQWMDVHMAEWIR